MEINEVEERIDDAINRASIVVQEKLKPANKLIADVKEAIKKGTDMISTSQLQEWALVIPIICEEIIPEKEAFALTKDLWDIEYKQLQAKNLLELDKKKTEIDNINKLAGTEHSKRKAMAEYVQNMLNGTQEALWCLGNAIGKILNARTAIGDCK